MDGDSDEELQRDVESLSQALNFEREGSPSVSEDTEQLYLILKKNKELQCTLRDAAAKIDRALQENARKRATLKTTGRVYLKKAFTPRKSYFDSEGLQPDLECDLSFPTGRNYHLEQNTWHVVKDDQVLRDHVLVEAKDVACRPLQEELSQTTDEQKIKEIKSQMNNSDPVQCLKDLCVDDVNWESIAKEAFNQQKTASDCRQRWLSVVSQSVNKAEWTKEETVKLMKLGKEFGGRNWKEIANLMGTGRFVFSYFQKYQTTFNSARTSQWSKSLDHQLKVAVNRFDTEINWYAVAKQVGRTVARCRQRWQIHLDPNIKRGRWSPEEDQRLKEAYAMFGAKNWCKISSLVPNRTGIQCRERWMNVLNPNLNKGSWTLEEDNKLMELCKQYEGNVIPWAKIAALLPKRTDTSCFTRWKTLTPPEDFAKHCKTVKKKRKIRSSSSLDLIDFDDDMIPEDEEMVVPKKRRNGLSSPVLESEEETNQEQPLPTTCTVPGYLSCGGHGTTVSAGCSATVSPGRGTAVVSATTVSAGCSATVSPGHRTAVVSAGRGTAVVSAGRETAVFAEHATMSGAAGCRTTVSAERATVSAGRATVSAGRATVSAEHATVSAEHATVSAGRETVFLSLPRSCGQFFISHSHMEDLSNYSLSAHSLVQRRVPLITSRTTIQDGASSLVEATCNVNGGSTSIESPVVNSTVLTTVSAIATRSTRPITTPATAASLVPISSWSSPVPSTSDLITSPNGLFPRSYHSISVLVNLPLRPRHYTVPLRHECLVATEAVPCCEAYLTQINRERNFSADKE